MERGNKFRCVVTGSGTLPILCAQVLLSEDHEICAIITSDAEVKRWTREKKIPHLEPSANIAKLLSREPFDYLFSIANEQILSEDVLKLPRKAAINYHDSLLPRYAGTHATSWALMNGETVHGVTWHLMTKVVDAGDILKQECFGIAEDETAITLNMKCYEAAINSFTRLVGELESGSILARKQNLDERTFFAFHRRPTTGCVISWRHCASAIDALVRALNFDSHPNPLGSPKLAVGNDFVIVPKITTTTEASHTPPGTITKIGTDFLRVATADHHVDLHRLLTLNGEPISIPELVARCGLHPGYRFTDLDCELAKRLEFLYAASSKHEAFWVERLASLEPAVFPYKKSTAFAEGPSFTSMPMLIPDEVVNFVKERQEEWSSDDFLLAAYGTFIARLGEVNSFDIAYCDSDLKREFAGLDKLFATHLPLRMDIDCSQGFAEILKALKKQVQSIREHSSYALDLVARYPELRSIRETSGKFALPLVVERVGRVNVNEMPAGTEIALNISEDRLEGRWIYDRDRLDDAGALSLRNHFTTFLSGIVANPNQPVASLSLLTEEERHQVLVQWNDNDADYPKDQCFQKLFEQQACRTPDADALIFGGRRLTYLELNHRANQLAHFLRSLGVGPDVPVALCVERSLEMVIGLLAVLKAGAAYLPLDSAYPRERLEFMLRDSQAPVLLTQQRLAIHFNQRTSKMVCLDTDWKVIAEHSERNPFSEVTPENLAYVLYTSGSTGHPKGVLIPHSALVSHSVSVAKHYELDPSDRVLQFASISFDVAAEELLATLLSGAAVVLPTWQNPPSLSDFIDLLEKERLTVINLPSCYWHELVLELELSLRSLSPTLRLVVTGSEKVLPERLSTWRKMVGNSIRWLNAYGPTEATVTTTIYEPDGTDEGHETVVVPIGRPMANRQIYILDSYLNPVPVGVRGELYIGGPGLARGYLNSPDITGEKFIPNHLEPEAGAKLYKTGDLARYLPSGNIEYLGRIDQQVKIRGFRVELGEVEAMLCRHPRVHECVIIGRENAQGEKRLVAYVVLSEQVEETIISDLRRLVKQQLPDYMVPSAFVVLDKLPLTVNGKLDRRALPAPDGKQFLENAFVPPRNTLESLLTKTWENVLEVQPIGIKDNFFELGGHSLLAVRLFAQIEKVCGKKLPLVTLFQAPTVEQLASLLSEEKWSPSLSSLVTIQPGGSKPPLFCLHLALGHVLFYRDLAQRLGSDQPVYAFQPQGLDGTQPRHTRIEEMASHYIKEMRALQPEGPYYLGGSSFGGLIAFEMAQQLHAQGQEVGLLALFDTYAPRFPKLSSEAGSLRYKVYRFMQRVNLHLGNLLLLEPERKVKYAREKAVLVKGRLKGSIKQGIESRVKKITEKLSHSNGHSMPGEDQQRIDVLQALREYVPQVYPGRVTLFRASKQRAGYDNDCDLGWGELAAGGVEIHEVPGHHGSIVVEPRVGPLAQELKRCIEKTLVADQPIEQTPTRLVDKTGIPLSCV